MPRRLKAEFEGRRCGGGARHGRIAPQRVQGELTTEALLRPHHRRTCATHAPSSDRVPRWTSTYGTADFAPSRPPRSSIRADRGSVDIVDPAGPVEIKTDFCRMDIRGTGGPVKITGEGGIIDLREVTHPLTIDADRLTVTAELDAPVATTHRRPRRHGGAHACPARAACNSRQASRTACCALPSDLTSDEDAGAASRSAPPSPAAAPS